MNNSWESGSAYDRYMGRWSLLAAGEFLTWLHPSPGLTWLDVGCGTGSLSKIILQRYNPAALIGIDPSSDFIHHARQAISDPRARFQLGSAETLDLQAASVDFAVSGLVFNFLSDPVKALNDMLRVTRPGGDIGIFLWDYADGMQMLRSFWDTAIELDPRARDLDEGASFPLCQAGRLGELLSSARLDHVESAALEIPTVFRDFDDYWQPFLGGVGPAPAYVMSLHPDDRHALEERLRRKLPAASDGSIHLRARLWAARGTVPASTKSL